MNDTEIDEIRAEFSRLAGASLQVARDVRQRAATSARNRTHTVDGPARPTEKEVLDARWAVDEAQRQTDPTAGYVDDKLSGEHNPAGDSLDGSVGAGRPIGEAIARAVNGANRDEVIAWPGVATALSSDAAGHDVEAGL